MGDERGIRLRCISLGDAALRGSRMSARARCSKGSASRIARSSLSNARSSVCATPRCLRINITIRQEDRKRVWPTLAARVLGRRSPMLADTAAALGLKNVRTTVTNACAEPETPAERAGKQLSPCLRHIKGGPNAPVCFLKAPHNSSCTRSFAGTMRTFGFPRGALHINANSLPINSELGRDHSWIPVTHTKT